MRFLLSLIIIIVVSCNSGSPKSEKKILDFGDFSLEVPQNWKKINVKGLDSYVGRIALDSGDKILFDLGWYSNSLTEEDNYQNSKNKIIWDSINGRLAKIVMPLMSGNGTTGVYFDSLWRAGSDNDRFNLYGVNLKPTNEKQVLLAIKTLKFHQRK